MLSNYGAGKDSWESLELQDQTNQSSKKSTLNIHWKDWCWSWSSKTVATWCEGLTHWERPWCWERLKAGGWWGWWQRTSWLDGITDSMDMSLSKLREMVKDRGAWHTIVHGVTKSLTWLSNWMTSKLIQIEAWLYQGWGGGARGPRGSNSFELKMLIYSSGFSPSTCSHLQWQLETWFSMSLWGSIA